MINFLQGCIRKNVKKKLCNINVAMKIYLQLHNKIFSSKFKVTISKYNMFISS